ncbi:hypothetical protein AVEN_207274-1 [Araneus ventricosus]|uniref:Uncharacterized protein n=1 Tax=Araneus ventricosus TaxID=182803 RepID=A0A4Y2ICV1_ARAVE|nr:hypothetical protein AVEN_207274-1 [Araneus ventricosus]
MLNLTSKVPDSKPDFIRDPSVLWYMLNSDVEGSPTKPDYLRSVLCDRAMLNLTSKVPVRNPISSEIRLVLSQDMLNLKSKVPDSNPISLRSVLSEPGHVN